MYEKIIGKNISAINSDMYQYYPVCDENGIILRIVEAEEQDSLILIDDKYLISVEDLTKKFKIWVSENIKLNDRRDCSIAFSEFCHSINASKFDCEKLPDYPFSNEIYYKI